MRAAFCLILALVGAENLGAQNRADTLAVFKAAAEKIGYDQTIEPASQWRVKPTDSLTLSFAAFLKQPTSPPPEDDKLFCQGDGGEASGNHVEAKLTFSSRDKALFQLFHGCTMKHQGKTWAFMQGDIVTLERRDGKWVATDHASLIS